jgi:hypothetical protein
MTHESQVQEQLNLKKNRGQYNYARLLLQKILNTIYLLGYIKEGQKIKRRKKQKNNLIYVGGGGMKMHMWAYVKHIRHTGLLFYFAH